MKKTMLSAVILGVLSSALHAEVVFVTAPTPVSSPSHVAAPPAQKTSQHLTPLSMTAAPSIAVTASPNAESAMEKEESPSYAAAQPLITEGGLRHHDTPGVAAVVYGFGRGLPLDAVLDIAVPNDWHIDWRTTPPASSFQVDWKGDVSWPEVLNRLGGRYGYRFTLVWSKKHVVINSASQDWPEIVPPAKLWELDPALTLKDNMQQWAASAGYTLVWEGVNYPVIAPVTFKGEFDATDGPVAQVMRGFEKSDQPLLAELTPQDKVLYIRNKLPQTSVMTSSSPYELVPEMFSKGHKSEAEGPGLRTALPPRQQ